MSWKQKTLSSRSVYVKQRQKQEEDIVNTSTSCLYICVTLLQGTSRYLARASQGLPGVDCLPTHLPPVIGLVRWEGGREGGNQHWYLWRSLHRYAGTRDRNTEGMQNIDELRELVGFFVIIYWLETKGFPGAKLSFISGIVAAWLMPGFSIIGLCGKSVLLWKWISNIFTFSCYNTFLHTSL